MTSPRAFLRVGAAVVVAVAMLAACSDPEPAAVPDVESLLTTTTPETAPPPGPAPDCGDATASLRPDPRTPTSGVMPAGSYMRQIQERGRLVVGVSIDTLLFGSVNPFTSEIEGFDIDVAREISKALFDGDPDRVELKAITYSERMPRIEDGTVDIVAHTMTINCARRERVDFSTVYYDAGQKVLVRKDSAATGIEDLAGEKVCAAASSTSVENLAKLADPPEIVEVVDQTDCLRLFQAGDVAAISTDDTILAGFVAQDPNAKVVGDRFSEEPYGLAISLEHPEFTRFVNAVLERMRADGTWKRIHEKWLDDPEQPTPEPPAATYRD
jgi:polar amino acid transport system substrate-binding protein